MGSVDGVAFRTLPGVLLADLATWRNGLTATHAGAILSFAETETLAALAEAEFYVAD